MPRALRITAEPRETKCLSINFKRESFVFKELDIVLLKQPGAKSLTFSVTDSKFRSLHQFIALAKASCTTCSFGMSEMSAQTTAPSCQKTAVNPLVS